MNEKKLRDILGPDLKAFYDEMKDLSIEYLKEVADMSRHRPDPRYAAILALMLIREDIDGALHVLGADIESLLLCTKQSYAAGDRVQAKAKPIPKDVN